MLVAETCSSIVTAALMALTSIGTGCPGQGRWRGIGGTMICTWSGKGSITVVVVVVVVTCAAAGSVTLDGVAVTYSEQEQP